MNAEEMEAWMKATPAGETRFALAGSRRWYNPMRWIKGDLYFVPMKQKSFEGVIKFTQGL